ncbi:MAG: cohesin domain-containing protein [Bryobacteraceae bacterium]
MKHLRLTFALCAWIGAVAFLLPAPAQAKNRKGDQLLKQGIEAEAKQDYDAALEFYNQAVDLSPGDVTYLLYQRRVRFQAGQKHVDAGQRLRSEGKVEEALKEFQLAVLRDPSSQIAMQEIRRTIQGLENDKDLPKSERGQSPVDRAKRETEQRVSSMMSPPDLKPISPQIQSLKMNNQPVKVLYETVGKLAGINVVFDSQYQPQGRNYNLDVSNTTLEEALDYLGIVTKTFWKPISSNTIFVTDDNVTKRRDYEDEVVRVFFVTNATSVQEFQEVATAIRSVIEVRRVFTYNAQKALVIRGTRDQIALAEKMIADLDRPKSEVVVDVIVMEANTTKSRSLAAAIANGQTFGLNVPIAYAPQNGVTTSTGSGSTATTSTAVKLSQIGKTNWGDYQTSLPGAFLQAVMSDRGTKVLQQPQVRSSDGMKVSLRIGDKIPYATGSFQPGVGSVGVSPLVSTQFNFAEVGVNVDMTPQVHSATEVTLHVEIEVSTVRTYVDLGGLSQPVIGQRKNTADIRLHSGELTLLGGLSQSTDTKTLSGIPWLVNIPVFGKLFGGDTVGRDSGDLLIALIPHIVRTPDYSPENLRGVYAGTDQLVRVNYAPKKESSVAAPGGTGPGAPVPATPIVSEPTPSVTAPVKPDVPPGSPIVRFTPPAAQISLSSALTATISLDNVKDLFSAAPIRVKWDPAQLRLSDFTPGEFMSRDGLRVTSVKDIRNDAGEATLTISRLPGAGGVKGSGTLATLTFMAIGKGDSKIAITELGLKNIQLQPIVTAAPELIVKVQ